MNTLPPIEALAGKSLNTLVDQVMLHGVDSKAPKPELLRQFAELVYINKMMEEGEVRMWPEERTALWNLMGVLREAIAKAPQDEVSTLTDKFRDQFGQERLDHLGPWEKHLLAEDLEALAEGGEPIQGNPDPIQAYFTSADWKK